MCGIAGFINKNIGSKDRFKSISLSLINQINHRGPDDSGFWIDHNDGISLCHTRLSIIDLSKNGAQPMTSNSQNLIISYNGEIYNKEYIKSLLIKNGVQFKGTSDTEVLLEACDKLGIEKTLNMLIGMFSFALWDKNKKKLFLVRDRLGIKPLYYGFNNGYFFFTSELKILKNLKSEFHLSINKQALSNFLSYSYIKNPETIYENIYKLEPGSILSVNLNRETNIQKYWQLGNFISEKYNTKINEKEFISEIDDLIHDSVRQRMLADVPIGCFLSGGIDSSLVASIMQKNSTSKINTFTIGFKESNYNEAIYAKKIAEHLNTNHNEFYFSDSEALDVIPYISSIYDEPFADSSQIPTYILSKFTGKSVKVSLSGDGGDEIFRGYNRYNWAKKFSKFNYYINNFIRVQISNFIKYAPYPLVENNTINRVVPNIKNKLDKISDIIKLETKEEIYSYLIKNNNAVTKILNYDFVDKNIFDYSRNLKISNFSQEMQYIDTLTYLPEDILTKVDRASMSVGLEVRVPLLDHRIVEKMMNKNISNFNILNNKHILKKILSNYIPEKLFKRPKMGFGVPLAHWLRGPLKSWSYDILFSNKNDKFFNHDEIEKLYKNHQNRKIDNSYKLWPILMYKSWKLDNYNE